MNIPDAEFIPSSGIVFREGEIQYRLSNEWGQVKCEAEILCPYVGRLYDYHIGSPQQAYEDAKKGILNKAARLKKFLMENFP